MNTNAMQWLGGSALVAGTFLLVVTQLLFHPVARTPSELSSSPDDAVAERRTSQEYQRYMPTAKPPRSPGAAVQGMLQEVQNHLRNALYTHPLFVQYQACQNVEEGCSELYEDALYAALTWPLRPAIARDEFGLEALVLQYGEEVVQKILAETCVWSPDPEERVVALALLEAMGQAGDELPPLPRATYAQLQTKPHVERDLLLQHFAQAPTQDPAVIDEIYHLAVDGSVSQETRRLALRALGHATTADALHESLKGWAATGTISREMALDTIAPALAQCGVACVDTITLLVTQREPEARLAAYWAFPQMEERERQAVLDLVVASFPPEKEWSFEERDQLQYLLTRRP